MEARLALSFQELADRVGVSPRTIANFVQRGDLEAVKLGRRTVVKASEVERWLNSRPVKNTRKEGK